MSASDPTPSGWLQKIDSLDPTHDNSRFLVCYEKLQFSLLLPLLVGKFSASAFLAFKFCQLRSSFDGSRRTGILETKRGGQQNGVGS